MVEKRLIAAETAIFINHIGGDPFLEHFTFILNQWECSLLKTSA